MLPDSVACLLRRRACRARARYLRRHLGRHRRARAFHAVVCPGRPGQERPAPRHRHLLHHLALRRALQELQEPLFRRCQQGSCEGPVCAARRQASALDGRLLSLLRTRGGLLPEQGRVGHPARHVHALRRGRGCHDHGRDQRRSVLGRVGRHLSRDAEDESRGQQGPANLLLGVQRAGHHGRPAALRPHLQRGQVQRPLVLLGRQAASALQRRSRRPPPIRTIRTTTTPTTRASFIRTTRKR